MCLWFGGGRWGYLGGGESLASPAFFKAFNLTSSFPPVALTIPFPVILSLPTLFPTLYPVSSFTSFLLALRSQIDFTSAERFLLIFPSKVGLSPTVSGFVHFSQSRHYNLLWFWPFSAYSFHLIFYGVYDKVCLVLSGHSRMYWVDKFPAHCPKETPCLGACTQLARNKFNW